MTDGAKESAAQAVEEVAVTKNLAKETVSVYDIYWLGKRELIPNLLLVITHGLLYFF